MREREGSKMGKAKEKEEMEKEKEKGERERDTAGSAPVGRDARDEDEQGDGTAMNSDVGTDFSGHRAGNDFEWTELND